MWLIVVRRICSVCGDGSVCGSGSVRCDDVLFWWRFALMHGWGMGRCLVVVVLAGGVGGGAYGCGGEERAVVVCEWGGVSVCAECVCGGVDGCSCVGGGGVICAGGWSWVRRVVWDGGCVTSVGRCSLVMSVDGRAVVGTGRV